MAKSKKKYHLKKGVIKLFASILFLVGYTILVLPTALDIYSRIGQTATIGGYDKEVNKLDEQEIIKAFENSGKYNLKIAQQHEEEFYRYTATTDYDEEYMSLPINDVGEMCTVVIPQINVNLSVGHGTNDSLLQVQGGHLYGTSLPTGGKSTHSVIAAHTALRTSEMFSRLDEIVEGDLIYIDILGERHAYKVEQIVICLPDECDQYLQVIPEHDYITLYTCTPYGINSHRLLVRAERTEYVPEVVEKSESTEVSTSNVKYKLMLGGIVLLPFAFIIIIDLPNKKFRKED